METIKLTRSWSDAARLTLARPARRNAVNAQMAAEIAHAATTIQGWGVQMAILDAEGPAFSAGADLSNLEEAETALASVVETLVNLPIHWTAAVRGPARGGILTVLAACPRVFATPDASFGLPEMTHGFFPSAVIGGQLALVGARRSFELAFQTSPIDAEEACAIGMVTEVIAEEELEGRLNVEAARMAELDSNGIRAGIEQWQAHARSVLC